MRFFAIASILFGAAVGVFASPVVERQTPPSIAAVLTDLTNTVTPLANLLFYATPQNATEAVLTPIIGDINNAVTEAITSLNLLVDQPLAAILASVDGTTTLAASDVAGLLATIVNTIFTAANAVLVVDSTVPSVIPGLLSSLGTVVFSLISVSLSLVTGLLAPLVVLLAPILSIINGLGLTTLFGELIGGLL